MLSTLSAIQILIIQNAIDRLDVPRVVKCASLSSTIVIALSLSNGNMKKKSFHHYKHPKVSLRAINLVKQIHGSLFALSMHCHYWIRNISPRVQHHLTLTKLSSISFNAEILMEASGAMSAVKVMLDKVRILEVDYLVPAFIYSVRKYLSVSLLLPYLTD